MFLDKYKHILVTYQVISDLVMEAMMVRARLE